LEARDLGAIIQATTGWLRTRNQLSFKKKHGTGAKRPLSNCIEPFARSNRSLCSRSVIFKGMATLLLLLCMLPLAAARSADQARSCEVVQTRYRDIEHDAITTIPARYPSEPGLRVTGTVKVLLLIDRHGDVLYASAICGHPLLVPPSIVAARGWRFPPVRQTRKRHRIGVISFLFNEPNASR